jgi:uncharacterized membrane protein
MPAHGPSDRPAPSGGAADGAPAPGRRAEGATPGLGGPSAGAPPGPGGRTGGARATVSRRLAGLIALAVGLAATIAYLWMSAEQLRRMDTPSWDLAIFTQLAKAYAGVSAPIVDVKGYGFNLLGDHFHPILVLLGPVYAAWPSPMAVMAVQDVLLGASAGILAWFGSRWIGPVRGATLGLGFALSFGVLEAVRVQFHEVAFAVPMLAASLCLLALRRFLPAALWAAPLVFVKEDLGVTAALVGILIAVLAGTRRGAEGRLWDARRPGVVPGALLCLWGVGWTLLAILVVLPALNPEGAFDYGDRVDLGAALADPLRSLALMVYPWQKAETLALILATGAVVFLRSPLALAGLPTLAWRFLSEEPGYWEPTWHYSLVIMPVLFAALLDAVLRGRRSGARRPGPGPEGWREAPGPAGTARAPAARSRRPPGPPRSSPARGTAGRRPAPSSPCWWASSCCRPPRWRRRRRRPGSRSPRPWRRSGEPWTGCPPARSWPATSRPSPSWCRITACCGSATRGTPPPTTSSWTSTGAPGAEPAPGTRSATRSGSTTPPTRRASSRAA